MKDKGHRLKPWQARVKRGKEEFFLGNYATKEEADTVEAKFCEERGYRAFKSRKSPTPHTRIVNGKVISIGGDE